MNWEYKAVDARIARRIWGFGWFDSKKLEKYLNQMNHEGWELVSTLHQEVWPLLIFRRQKK